MFQSSQFNSEVKTEGSGTTSLDTEMHSSGMDISLFSAIVIHCFSPFLKSNLRHIMQKLYPIKFSWKNQFTKWGGNLSREIYFTRSTEVTYKWFIDKEIYTWKLPWLFQAQRGFAFVCEKLSVWSVLTWTVSLKNILFLTSVFITVSS